MPEVIDACRAAAEDLSAIVKSGDPAAFEDFFKKDSRHLGEYCSRGQALTDRLIDCMVRK